MDDVTDDAGALSQPVATPGIVEVAATGTGGTVQPPKKPAARQMPKWETEARDRVRTAIRRFAKPLADLVARDANEGDTRLLVTDFLCDGGLCETPAISSPPALVGNVSEHGDTPHQIMGNGFPDR